MRRKEEYLKLYRPDFERFIFLELFFGNSEKWQVQIIHRSAVDFLKEKIFKKFQQKKSVNFRQAINSADIFCNPARLSLK